MVKVCELILNSVHLNVREKYITINGVHDEGDLQIEKLATKGLALANVALLVAEGYPRRYVAVLRALFAENQLSSPDMDIMFDLQLL